MVEVRIADIVVGERSRKDLGDIDALASSLGEVGLLQPVVVTPDCKLVAGQRRLEAARLLGWDRIPAHIVSNLGEAAMLIRAEAAENTCRKDFSPSEAVAVGRRLEGLEAPAAEQRRKEGNRAGGQVAGKLPVTYEVSDAVGSVVGMSGRTYKKAREVVAAAQAEPERFGRLVQQMDRSGKVNGAYKQLANARKAAEIAAEPPPLPAGPFRVIAADPPWQYDERGHDVTHKVANPYPSMSLEQIKALPVAALAHADAVLWLWTTNAHIGDACDVVRAWGFQQKTMLTWVKNQMGNGDWLRGRTEHCLLAVRGKPVVTLTNQTTDLVAPKRDHSRKPDEFYALVESLCPGSKVELFSRTPRPGWAAWGNECGQAAPQGGGG